MFFESTKKRYYRIDQIRTIYPAKPHPEGHSDVHRVEFISGEEVEIYSRTFQTMMWKSGPILPAAAGTNIVRYFPGETPEVLLTAVIGWSVDVDGFTVPITAQGLNDDDDEAECHVIQHPDGSIVIPCEGSFRSLDEFLAAKKA